MIAPRRIPGLGPALDAETLKAAAGHLIQIFEAGKLEVLRQYIAEMRREYCKRAADERWRAGQKSASVGLELAQLLHQPTDPCVAAVEAAIAPTWPSVAVQLIADFAADLDLEDEDGGQ